MKKTYQRPEISMTGYTLEQHLLVSSTNTVHNTHEYGSYGDINPTKPGGGGNTGVTSGGTGFEQGIKPDTWDLWDE